MALSIRVYANSDDALIIWRSERPIKDCVGFELRRRRNGVEEVVRNRISFSGAEPDPSKPESSKTSPFRRYAWVDHEVNSGDKVAYRAVPVIQSGSAPAVIHEDGASPFSDPVEVTGWIDEGFECYFNRGLLISQFMSRYLKNDLSPRSLKAFKDGLNAEKESQMRVFLGGDLRGRLFELLDQPTGHVYAALYELSDDAIIRKLEKLSGRAHVVLSNGTHTSREDDENKAARKALRKARCEVHDRMLPAKVLGHNKFLVVTDEDRNPRSVWTGSTNWTPTGLCTQINNGLLVNDSGIAAAFLEQWERLRDGGSQVPSSLVAENSRKKGGTVTRSDVEAWFARTSSMQEMKPVIDLIDGAKQGIVFLMFMPGKSPILDAVVSRQAERDPPFVKGVVSTLDKKEMDKAQVSLVTRGAETVHGFRVVQPQGLKGVGRWAAEVSRQEFLSQVGFAIVHSKMIVIDPCGEKPAVITGSHNFSISASSRNDENLVIIRGNAALAQAYALHIQSVFDHYNYRAVANAMKTEGKNITEVMKDPKSWQKSWFGGDKKRELDCWFGV